jgi:hypothetical protein
MQSAQAAVLLRLFVLLILECNPCPLQAGWLGIGVIRMMHLKAASISVGEISNDC